jgi:hypothetical protein
MQAMEHILQLDGRRLAGRPGKATAEEHSAVLALPDEPGAPAPEDGDGAQGAAEREGSWCV